LFRCRNSLPAFFFPFLFRRPGFSPGVWHWKWWVNLFGYDASGNATGDGTFTYLWDGESQLKSANGVNYLYDGDGRRVSKSNGKLYWYGANGEIIQETDDAGHTLNTYVFFGGKRIEMQAVGAQPQLYVEDSLGSSRIVTTNTGTVCYDADFTPYGGEQPITSTCSQNYKFEGKERDTETGNDEFGARYYTNRFGRWLSADWSGVPVAVPYADLTNPQTLNLYSMVSDDPETAADLDGHCCISMTLAKNLEKGMSAKQAQVGIGVLEVGAAIASFGISLEAQGLVVAASAAVTASGLFVSGTTRIIATAAGEKPEQVEKAATTVTTLTNPVGFVAAVATGSTEKGGEASDVSAAAQLAAHPMDAMKDPAGTVLTVGNILSDVKSAVADVKTLLTPPPPPPHPTHRLRLHLPSRLLKNRAEPAISRLV
jgi:RHS repeat-associated protein